MTDPARIMEDADVAALSSEQEESDSLTEQEEQLLGEYTDILVKHDVATADEFLETLPERPRARVQDLLQTARLLHLAASAKRPTPVTK